jgi:hypothetical protein
MRAFVAELQPLSLYQNQNLSFKAIDSNRHGAGVVFVLGEGSITIVDRQHHYGLNLNAFQRAEKRFKGCFLWNQ